jgi:uncharacterized protein DUF6220
MNRPRDLAPIVRWAYAVVAWALVAALLAQFFFAGIGVFAAGGYGAHAANASGIALLMLLTLAGSAAARRPWRATALHGVLLLLLVVQSLLVTGPGPVAALHPLNGAVILLLAAPLAWRALQAARRGEPYRLRQRHGEV